MLTWLKVLQEVFVSKNKDSRRPPQALKTPQIRAAEACQVAKQHQAKRTHNTEANNDDNGFDNDLPTMHKRTPGQG
jgi:hypothetical protein